VSLKSFHIVLITLSSVLALVFGGWSVHAYVETGGIWFIAAAVFSFAAAVGLVIYVTWFARKIRTPEEEERRRRRAMRSVPVLLAVLLLASDPVPACSVCYGDAAGPLIDAARLGVYLLFGLVAAIQVAFLFFFLHLRRRAREYRRNHAESGWVEL